MFVVVAIISLFIIISLIGFFVLRRSSYSPQITNRLQMKKTVGINNDVVVVAVMQTYIPYFRGVSVYGINGRMEIV